VLRKNGTYDPEEGESFPFHQDDLMYKHIDVKKKPITSAVIFFIMDVSGSMDKHKKFLARSFFFLLYQFIRYKYEKVDLVFISHTTEGKEVNEDDFFKSASTGGTMISSGLQTEISAVENRYPPVHGTFIAFTAVTEKTFKKIILKHLKQWKKLSDSLR
jgi:uncharacterized protein